MCYFIVLNNIKDTKIRYSKYFFAHGFIVRLQHLRYTRVIQWGYEKTVICNIVVLCHNAAFSEKREHKTYRHIINNILGGRHESNKKIVERDRGKKGKDKPESSNSGNMFQRRQFGSVGHP